MSQTHLAPIQWTGIDTDGTPAKVGAAAITPQLWMGGPAVFVAEGTFGSGTVTLMVTPPGGSNRLTVDASTTVTAEAVVPISLGRGTYDFDLAGATGADLNVSILPA